MILLHPGVVGTHPVRGRTLGWVNEEGRLSYDVSTSDLLRIRDALVEEGWGSHLSAAVAGIDALIAERASEPTDDPEG